MPQVFEFPLTVPESDIDELGHVNNLAYLKWAISAAMAHSAAQGWPAEAYRTLGSGWVVRSHQIEYLQPAFAGDQIVVRTWVVNMKKVTSLRRYEITRVATGAKLAVAATDWAFIHFATGMPKRVPPEIAQAFELLPDEGTVPY